MYGPMRKNPKDPFSRRLMGVEFMCQVPSDVACLGLKSFRAGNGGGECMGANQAERGMLSNEGHHLQELGLSSMCRGFSQSSCLVAQTCSNPVTHVFTYGALIYLCEINKVVVC